MESGSWIDLGGSWEILGLGVFFDCFRYMVFILVFL